MKTEKIEEEICENCGKTKKEHFRRNVRDMIFRHNTSCGDICEIGIHSEFFCTKYGKKKFKLKK